MNKLVLVFSSIFLFVVCVNAESLSEKKRWTEENEELTKLSPSVEEKCGKKIEVSIDKASFKNYPKSGDIIIPAVGSLCSNTLQGIAEVCATPDGKTAVVKTIKKIICKYSAEPKEEKKEVFELKGGTFTYSFGRWSISGGDATKKYLMDNLE